VGASEGTPVAQAHLLPHVLRLRGIDFPVCYIVGVCVDESLRGTRIGKTLMVSVMEEAGRRGFLAGILQPRYPDFYRKLGWDYFVDKRVFRAEIPSGIVWRDQPERFSAACPSDWKVINDIYTKYTAGLHAYAVRDARHWETLLAEHCGDGGKVCIFGGEESPRAYALYHLRFGNLAAREVAYTDPAARDSLLTFLSDEAARTGSEWMEWTDPGDAPSFFQLRTMRQDPFLMARLTDPLKALKRCAPAIEEAEAAVDMFVDEAALTQLLFGYCSVTDLMANKRIRASSVLDAALWGKALPVERNYTNEYF
jgi:predicted acetyltransferase